MDHPPVEFNLQALTAQRSARAMMKHEARFLAPLAAVGFMALFGLSLVFARQISPYVILIAFGLYYVAFRAVTNWRQWAALQKFQLACPACGRQLAEQIHYFKSPSSKCPHCGQVALASIKQLNNP